MSRNPLPHLLLAVACLLAIHGCRGPGSGPRFDPRPTTSAQLGVVLTNTLNPELLRPNTNEFRLGPGDHIDIELVGRQETQTAALVGPDGRVYFDLLPGLNVWGLTLRDARDLIAREMEHYVNHPRVSVVLREVHSRRIWVVGRVSTPGLYSLNTPTTLLEAITRAGGLAVSGFTGTTEELADLRHSFVMRGGTNLPVDLQRLLHEGDMTQNIYLEPDDFVYLPSATSTEVYVLGAVNQPRAVTFKDQVTLSSAISLAGGWLPTARPGEVVIVRGSLAQPACAVVDFAPILKGKAPDIRLQPRDIVYVPDAPMGTLRRAADLIVRTFVRTIAANEGLRAGGTEQNVGVNIPVGP